MSKGCLYINYIYLSDTEISIFKLFLKAHMVEPSFFMGIISIKIKSA